MSEVNVMQRAEKQQFDSMIDVKENTQDERVSSVLDPYTEEAERLKGFAGPKVQVKILLMNSQNHVFVFEPETTIGRVKESIWHLWPSGWITDPARPPSPAYFRLLYMGKMLTDEQTLSSSYTASPRKSFTEEGLNMKVAPAVTIIHLSVRTIPPEEETVKKSLLGFSLRPSMRGRGSSANVPTANTAINPNNNVLAPIVPFATPTPAAASAGSAALPVTSRTVPTPSQATNNVTTIRTRSRGAAVDDGTHGASSGGGGCKCVIM
ncbi:hypothetical protein QFC21_003673 [Naganishia friedmannii]|uniref:Uncharacterized protein n=1 Tax=Naganishia friedmannii TaxID=89922 RepID=A0ACC2VMH9_9TREE|nr:hypothetical protein QFC21_003673 [Naganishia friedmannii]